MFLLTANTQYCFLIFFQVEYIILTQLLNDSLLSNSIQFCKFNSHFRPDSRFYLKKCIDFLLIIQIKVWRLNWWKTKFIKEDISIVLKEINVTVFINLFSVVCLNIPSVNFRVCFYMSCILHELCGNINFSVISHVWHDKYTQNNEVCKLIRNLFSPIAKLFLSFSFKIQRRNNNKCVFLWYNPASSRIFGEILPFALVRKFSRSSVVAGFSSRAGRAEFISPVKSHSRGKPRECTTAGCKDAVVHRRADQDMYRVNDFNGTPETFVWELRVVTFLRVTAIVRQVLRARFTIVCSCICGWKCMDADVILPSWTNMEKNTNLTWRAQPASWNSSSRNWNPNSIPEAHIFSRVFYQVSSYMNNMHNYFNYDVRLKSTSIETA